MTLLKKSENGNSIVHISILVIVRSEMHRNQYLFALELEFGARGGAFDDWQQLLARGVQRVANGLDFKRLLKRETR